MNFPGRIVAGAVSITYTPLKDHPKTHVGTAASAVLRRRSRAAAPPSRCSKGANFRARLLDEIHLLFPVHPIFVVPRFIHASMDFEPGAGLGRAPEQVPGFEIFLIPRFVALGNETNGLHSPNLCSPGRCTKPL